MGETHFLCRNWVQKPQNCNKSISREQLVVQSCLTTQNDWKTWFTTGVFRYTHPSNNRKCSKITISVFWGLIMTQLDDFPYLVNRRSYKVSWPHKIITGMGLIWVFYNTYTPQTTKSNQKWKDKEKYFYVCLFLFFSGLIWRNFKIFCFMRRICQIKLVELSKWPKGLFYISV